MFRITIDRQNKSHRLCLCNIYVLYYFAMKYNVIVRIKGSQITICWIQKSLKVLIDQKDEFRMTLDSSQIMCSSLFRSRNPFHFQDATAHNDAASSQANKKACAKQHPPQNRNAVCNSADQWCDRLPRFHYPDKMGHLPISGHLLPMSGHLLPISGHFLPQIGCVAKALGD